MLAFWSNNMMTYFQKPFNWKWNQPLFVDQLFWRPSALPCSRHPNFPLPPKRSVTFSPPQLHTFIYLLISTPAAAPCAAPLSPEPDLVARPAMSLITWATGTSGSDCERASAVNEGDYIGAKKRWIAHNSAAIMWHWFPSFFFVIYLFNFISCNGQ